MKIDSSTYHKLPLMLLARFHLAEICIGQSIISKYARIRVLFEAVVPVPSHKTRRMAIMSTTLPIPMLETIDQLVHESKVPSRSYVIREAVRDYLKIFG